MQRNNGDISVCLETDMNTRARNEKELYAKNTLAVFGNKVFKEKANKPRF